MTLWLTRILPDLRRSDVETDLRDAVQMHHRVMKLFPQGLGEQARQVAGVLFRVDQDAIGTSILVQSGIEPDPSRLPESYGQSAVRTMDALLDALRPGLPVRYRLTGNAVRRLGRNTQAGKPLSTVPLNGAEAEAWWTRQGEQSGMALRMISVTSLDAAVGIRIPAEDPRPQRQNHARTRFDGTALITDPELLRTRLIAGIGRGKSYGCGLLTIAPGR